MPTATSLKGGEDWPIGGMTAAEIATMLLIPVEITAQSFTTVNVAFWGNTVPCRDAPGRHSPGESPLVMGKCGPLIFFLHALLLGPSLSWRPKQSVSARSQISKVSIIYIHSVQKLWSLPYFPTSHGSRSMRGNGEQFYTYWSEEFQNTDIPRYLQIHYQLIQFFKDAWDTSISVVVVVIFLHTDAWVSFYFTVINNIAKCVLLPVKLLCAGDDICGSYTAKVLFNVFWNCTKATNHYWYQQQQQQEIPTLWVTRLREKLHLGSQSKIFGRHCLSPSQKPLP